MLPHLSCAQSHSTPHPCGTQGLQGDTGCPLHTLRPLGSLMGRPGVQGTIPPSPAPHVYVGSLLQQNLFGEINSDWFLYKNI